jgi:hypothetical protein
MFTKVPVVLRVAQQEPVSFDAIVNIANILTVFPDEKGTGCSAMMIGGHKLSIDMTFAALSERLLELRKSPLDA